MLKAGDKHTVSGVTRHIVDIENKTNGQWIHYTKDDSAMIRKCPAPHFWHYYRERKTGVKSLDQAFKELDRKICSHLNIRKDRFFSAMVYKTCKDCGQPLN